MVYIVLIFFAIASRFLPHLSNVAAISALAIFAGYYLPKKQAIAVPLAARLVSDLFIGFFSPVLMVAVYGAHLLGVFFGAWIKNKKSDSIPWLKVVGASLGASISFYLITNFALLYSISQYQHNWQGIMLSYVNGLPFLRGTIIGDVGYTVVMFGAYALATYLVKRHQANKMLRDEN